MSFFLGNFLSNFKGFFLFFIFFDFWFFVKKQKNILKKIIFKIIFIYLLLLLVSAEDFEKELKSRQRRFVSKPQKPLRGIIKKNHSPSIEEDKKGKGALKKDEEENSCKFACSPRGINDDKVRFLGSSNSVVTTNPKGSFEINKAAFQFDFTVYNENHFSHNGQIEKTSIKLFPDSEEEDMRMKEKCSETTVETEITSGLISSAEFGTDFNNANVALDFRYTTKFSLVIDSEKDEFYIDSLKLTNKDCSFEQHVADEASTTFTFGQEFEIKVKAYVQKKDVKILTGKITLKHLVSKGNTCSVETSVSCGLKFLGENFSHYEPLVLPH